MNIPLNLYFISSSDQLTYLLIDQTNKLIGYCLLFYDTDKYIIQDFATEKGYGPFFCDTLMLYLDLPLNPSINLTLDFFNVWKKYYNNRTDVTKLENIEIEKRLYINDKNNKEIILTDKDGLNIINHSYTIYDRKKRQSILNWYERSKTFEIKMSNKITNYINIMINKGKQFFRKKYHI